MEWKALINFSIHQNCSTKKKGRVLRSHKRKSWASKWNEMNISIWEFHSFRFGPVELLDSVLRGRRKIFPFWCSSWDRFGWISLLWFSSYIQTTYYSHHNSSGYSFSSDLNAHKKHCINYNIYVTNKTKHWNSIKFLQIRLIQPKLTALSLIFLAINIIIQFKQVFKSIVNHIITL